MTHRRARSLVLAAIVATLTIVATPSANAAPANDHYTDATPITGLSGEVGGSNAGATGADEFNSNCFPGDKSVWYVWTAPTTADFDLLLWNAASNNDPGSSAPSPMLEVCDGATLDTGVEVMSVHGTSGTFHAASGTTYHIALAAYGGSSSYSFNLLWSPHWTLTPASGPPGTVMTFSGGGCGGFSAAYTVSGDMQLTNFGLTVQPDGTWSGTRAVPGPVPTGTYTFVAGCGVPGDNDFTIRKTFTVTPTLTATPTSMEVTQPVSANWSGLVPSGNDWISLHATDAPDTTYLEWHYAICAVSPCAGSVGFTAPSSPGNYEFRLFRNGIKVATSAAFTVTPASIGQGQEPSLAVSSPTGLTMNGAMPFDAIYENAPTDGVNTIAVTTSGTSTALVSETSISDSAGTIHLYSPWPSGTYHVSLMHNGNVVKFQPIVVQAASVSATLTVNEGQLVTVNWGGVVPALVGITMHTYLRVAYDGGDYFVDEVTSYSGSRQYLLPAGSYDIVLQREHSEIAELSSINVVKADLKVSSKQFNFGDPISVSWKHLVPPIGNDRIVLTKWSQLNDGSIVWLPVRTGDFLGALQGSNSTEWKAPADAGTYRMHISRNGVMVAEAFFTVGNPWKRPVNLRSTPIPLPASDPAPGLDSLPPPLPPLPPTPWQPPMTWVNNCPPGFAALPECGAPK